MSLTDGQLICVGLDREYWPIVKNEVERALAGDGGRMTIDDLYAMLDKGTAQIWALHNGDLKAVMTTQILNYPQIRAVRIITVTGKEMELWLDVLIDTISRWGKEQGADVIDFVGRVGWDKVLSKRGFVNKQIFMTKPI